MSRFTTEWEWVKSVGQALVDAGHFNALFTGVLPDQIPTTQKNVLFMRPTDYDDQEDRRDIATAQFSYEILVLRHDFGMKDGYDPVTGTVADPGYGVLADLVRDTFQTNLKTHNTCKWEWGKSRFLERNKHPKLGAVMTLTIHGFVAGHNRANGISTAISVPELTTNLDDLTDVVLTAPSNGEVLKYDGTNWVNDTDDSGTTIDELDDIGDVNITSPATGALLEYDGGDWVDSEVTVTTDEASLNLPLLSSTPTSPANGDFWIEDDGGTVTIFYKRSDNGQLLKRVLLEA